jgi:hypothetical protein
MVCCIFITKFLKSFEGVHEVPFQLLLPPPLVCICGSHCQFKVVVLKINFGYFITF